MSKAKHSADKITDNTLHELLSSINSRLGHLEDIEADNRNFIINYEKLINDQKNETKKLINFCELDWDENCLNFYKNNKTPITTVSVAQARKPIYSTSIDLNKNYDKNLRKLFSMIN